MRVVLSGGGTGGHIYPALALQKNILAHYPDAEFLYIGTAQGMEAKIVPEQGIPFKTVRIQGLKRSLSMDNLKTAFYMLQSVSAARKLLKDFQPDVVVGTGGYVCAPVLYAASHLGLPTVIHEQNSVAGITNKFLSRYVDKIAICFDRVKADFSRYAHKIGYTGNPRAQEVAAISDKVDLTEYGLVNNRPTLLIFGGSRGAQRINDAVMASLEAFTKRPYQVLIATGEIYYDDYQKEFDHLDQLTNVKVVPYIKNMPQLFNTVDLVVCRSGATTLTELTALGTPSLLIPSPNVTGNHQQRNAESLVDHRAAKMLLEEDLNNDLFLEMIDELMADDIQRVQMSQQARLLGVPDAADRLRRVLETAIEEK